MNSVLKGCIWNLFWTRSHENSSRNEQSRQGLYNERVEGDNKEVIDKAEGLLLKVIRDFEVIDTKGYEVCMTKDRI